MLNINDYLYDLPHHRIAAEPLQQRDASKLLVYRSGNIEHHTFKNLADFLPANSFLFFNDTKVIPARLHFQKDSGAEIEIFLLSPKAPHTLLATAMLAKKQCTWQCTIGNLKRWKDGQLLSKQTPQGTLTAELVNRSEGLVTFRWEGEASFAEVITRLGETPLPPYIRRKANANDVGRYQTIYSHHEGAVAAPTAGLHFTDQVFESLREKKIDHDFLTLHVSAGTFQPVKVENALTHTMHHEQVVVNRKTIDHLVKEKFVVAVGTTSMRTLESLYWYGVALQQHAGAEFNITQHDPYITRAQRLSAQQAFQHIARYMDNRKLEQLTGTTSIFIHPGYAFNVCKGLITNFHQPGSTLMLLVAAFIGERWKQVYDEALTNDYRFLSYGDSSLLLPKN